MIQIDEATKIVRILLTADGGCSVCTRSLIKGFYEAFPEFKEMAQSMYCSKFDEPMFDYDEDEDED